MIVSLVLGLAGILLKKASLPLIGAVIFLPPAWYLSHYSPFLGILPLFLLLCARAVSRNKTLLAFLAIAPILLVMSVLGYLVLSQ